MLELRSIESYYGKIQALKGITLEVPEGGIVTILGANGAGKTTTLKAVCGLLHHGGHVRYNGEDVSGRPAYQLVELGIALVPEGRRLFPKLTVEENLLIGLPARRDKIKKIPDFIFELFPVLKEMLGRRGGDLSGGQQQQLAIGRALMSNPKLLCIDEPSTGLAPIMKEEVFKKIAAIKNMGITVLLVEQEVNAVFALASRNYVLSSGKIIAEGTGAELLKDEVLRKTYLGLLSLNRMLLPNIHITGF